METEKVTIDLRNSEIQDFELERESEGARQVRFLVKGVVREIDEQKIEDALLSNVTKPISVSLVIERPEDR
ncbi:MULTISPECIES: hypothetical protein [Halostella]|uniref:hypothetical protein n=1 Tax=Halostella TaxID=1843185 RepID=UPI001080708E|nr:MULTISPECIES: hypothetical protein [Halostella]